MIDTPVIVVDYDPTWLNLFAAAVDCIITRLARDADTQTFAHAEPALRPRLVAELLRIDSPVMMALRRAARDLA